MIQHHPDIKNVEAQTLHSFLNHNKGIVYRHSLAYLSSGQASLGNSLYK
jgi:hypothetical protein